MNIKCTSENRILEMLEAVGYEAYFVGGCVRDALMDTEKQRNIYTIADKEQGDIDITTNALSDEIKKVFLHWKVIETGIKHGTVTVLMPQADDCNDKMVLMPQADNHVDEMASEAGHHSYGGLNAVPTTSTIPVEITTYRSDGNYSDSRHPDKVHFVTSLKEDLQRRDFTINAIACDVRGAIEDPFNGAKDIEQKIIRAVGDADRRFKEDALRIMRALRFAAVLDFAIESDTEKALFRNKTLLKNISAERIFAELKKLVTGKNAGNVVRCYVDVLGEVIPELCAMKGFLQHNHYHKYDVLEHCIRAMETVRTTPKNADYMKLATLFHDIGKPQTYTMDAEGVGHFYKHSDAGSRLAQDILKRLKADSFTVERVGVLTKYHDLVFEKDPKLLKRWMNRFTPEVLFEILAIKRADNFATGNMSHELEQKFDDIEIMMHDIIEHQQCFSLKELALKGEDIITLGVDPGPEVGQVLNALLVAVIDEEVENRQEDLKALAINMLSDWKLRCNLTM